MRLRGQDGQYRWHKIRLVPVRHEGDIAEWVVTAIDIDDMVRSRQALLEATDLFSLSQEVAGAGSWDLGLRDGKVRLSRESAKLHGIGDHAVEMDIDAWKRIVNADDAETVLAALRTAVDERTTYNGEFRVLMEDGGVRWLSGIGRAYYDENGKSVRMIGLNFDITDRKTVEAELLQANAEAEESKRLAEQARQHAEEANMAKGDFLASMSHEIRTPLNSIIGYTDLLLEDLEHGSSIRRKLEVIQQSGAAVLTVVNDILDFSKIEAGQIEIVAGPFSPGALVDDVASMLSGMAQHKGIALRRHVAQDVPPYALGDVSRLRQILLNLVNNAVKFTDAGSVAIDVTREASDGADDVAMIRFSVIDSGIGISPEQRHRLFQRFSQADGSINKRFGGTGLGLAICKQLVELMNGQIDVESREGGGSTFWFRVALPVAAAPDVERRTDRPPDDGKPDRPIHILLVEDTVVNQDLAKAVLERAGHVVDVASNGIEAIEALRHDAYDVVLMDVQMPVMDGIAATQAIRASAHASRHTPIIAMTANVLPQQIAGLKQAGMDDHVGKPFRMPELLTAVERWAADRTSPPDGGSPEWEPAIDRFDAEAFAALQDIIGEAALRRCMVTFAAELTARFVDLTPSCDVERVVVDAHATVPAAEPMCFPRLASLLRRASDPSLTLSDSFFSHLATERGLALADLGGYLAAADAPP